MGPKHLRGSRGDEGKKVNRAKDKQPDLFDNDPRSDAHRISMAMDGSSQTLADICRRVGFPNDAKIRGRVGKHMQFLAGTDQDKRTFGLPPCAEKDGHGWKLTAKGLEKFAGCGKSELLTSPDEIAPGAGEIDGEVREALVKIRNRSAKNRAACIAQHGVLHLRVLLRRGVRRGR